MLQTFARHDAIKGGIRKHQRLSIRRRKMNVIRFWKRPFKSLLGDNYGCRREIHRREPAPERGKIQCKVAIPTTDFENRLSFDISQQLQRIMMPLTQVNSINSPTGSKLLMPSVIFGSGVSVQSGNSGVHSRPFQSSIFFNISVINSCCLFEVPASTVTSTYGLSGSGSTSTHSPFPSMTFTP